MADAFYIKKIENKYVLGLLDPILIPINNHIYSIVNHISSKEVHILKTDLNLKFIWGQTFKFTDDRDSNVPDSFKLVDAIEMDNGDVIFTGKSGNGYVPERGIVLKLNSNGNLIWCKETSNRINGANFIELKNYDNDKIIIHNRFNTLNAEDAPNATIFSESFIALNSNGIQINSNITHSSLFSADYLITDKKIITIGYNYNSDIFITITITTIDTLEATSYNISRPDTINKKTFFENVSIIKIKDTYYVYLLDSTNHQFISFNFDLSNIESINSVDSFKLVPDSETVSQSYLSYKNEKAIYAFYNNSSTNTIFYKFEPTKGLVWKKEVPKYIKELISTNELVIAIINESPIDTDAVLCKMNLNFNAGDCLDINDVTSNTSVKLSVSISKINSFPFEKDFDFEDTPLNIIPITDYEVLDICTYNNFPDLTKSTITANPTTINADGKSTTTITVNLKDSDGNPYIGNATVVINTTKGSISSVTTNNDGTYTAILTSSTVAETAVVSFTVNGEQAVQRTKVVFETVQITCPAHVALIVDESSSIDSNEASQIKLGLQAFVDSQLGSNLTLSIIGMSDSDNNLRSDHILEQKVTNTSKTTFDSWVSTYRNRGVSGSSDKWASALEVVNSLSIIPDVVIAIADGLVVIDSSILLNLVKQINNKSHLFVYALQEGFYDNGIDPNGRRTIEESLAYYLGRTPIKSTLNNDILITDFQEGIIDFNKLGEALSNLNKALIEAEVGCGNIAITSTSFTNINLKPSEEILALEVGFITLKNDKSSSHTVIAGSQIAAVNGIIISTLETIIVPTGATINIPTVLSGIPSKSGEFTEIISLAGVLNPDQLSVELSVGPTQVTCPAHVAFLIDESGSINNRTTNEIDEIKNGLRSFIELQEGSNLTISLIGMSDSDTNTRKDHVLEQKVTNTSKTTFNNWISNFRNGRVKGLSHHWSSGLDVIEGLSSIPDIIIIVADGAQASSSTKLFDAVKKANNKSHLFVYALDKGLYHNGLNFSRRTIEDTLAFYWNRAPIPSTSNNDILITDYTRGINSFEKLSTALKGLNDSLIEAEVGCGNIAIISTSFDEITLFSQQEVVGLEIGSISLQNDKGSPHVIKAGTQLISTNGLVVTAIAEVIIPSGAVGIVPVILVGTPFKNGEFEEIISVAGVLNPEELTIKILVKPLPKINYTQSPFVYLQAAGSTGQDGSAKGVHLRWIFKNTLGDNHLPKGTLAANSNGFNKPNDFVKICKVPYEKEQITIDFNDLPTFVFSGRRSFIFLRRMPFWVYEVEGNRYIIYFNNITQYQNSARTINPETNPIEFLQSYGNNSIEVETSYSLAFSVEFIVTNSVPNSSLQTELISTEEKLLADRKHGIVARKTFQSNQFSTTFQQAEDIKRIRFRANNCIVSGIKVELYATIVEKADKEQLWEEMGEYALTNNDTKAFEYLEPKAGLIDGKWPRFNEGDLVNIKNYQNKWNNDKKGAFEKDIKQIVADYIRLSNNQNNPSGKELISFSEDDTDPQEIAYADILNIAAADYHIARMLGLGCFDLSGKTETQQYVYAIKYTTKNKIENYIYDDDKNFEVEHIYTSLPTSNTDQRLPLPFQLDKLRPGVPSGLPSAEQLDDQGNVVSVEPSMSLLNEDGYSKGRSRFISLFVEDDQENEILVDFYQKTTQFNSSNYTVPVFGGIEQKVEDLDGNTAWKPGDTPWDKPELSITQEYFNKTASGKPTPEIIPLGIPEKEKPLFVHKQTQEGIYYYGTYGINWFSRVSPVQKALSIKTEFVPDNNLLPPHNINALHIVEERPLLLTSISEQKLLQNNTKTDDTLVRLAFEYNTTQELVSYKITDRLKLEANDKLKEVLSAGDNPLLHHDAVYKDKKEIFADHIEVFFRNEIPQNIRGKIIRIADHPSDDRISVITTDKYKVYSNSDEENEEYLIPELPTGTTSQNFEGGIFTTNGTNFFIESIIDNSTNLIINVFKKEIENGSIQTTVIPRRNIPLEAPQIMNDALFMALENMSATETWGPTNPNKTFKVNLDLGDHTKIHREIIVNNEGPDDQPEEVLEKSRGFWGEAKITKVDQVIEINDDGTPKKEAHRGLYLIEMPFMLAEHSQNKPDAIGNFVEWSGGIVRVHTANNNTGPRKNLNVIRIENIGSTTKNVALYVSDDSFGTVLPDADGNIVIDDAIQIGDKVEVNFYPGYKAYLYADTAFNLTKNSITPTDEELKYSIFGLRSRDLDGEKSYNKIYVSQVSAPAMMFVHKITDPLQPDKPKGALYATPPDSFGKATYTLTTSFKQQPYGVLYYRSNDRSILGALYTNETVNKIITKLESYDPDPFYANRWDNLLGFDYKKSDDSDEKVVFETFPKNENAYRFPLPNKPAFFKDINDEITRFNTINKKSIPAFDPEKEFDLSTVVIPELIEGLDTFPEKTVATFVEKAIMNSFVSLTEVPLLYDYIEGEAYQPTAKRQVIRDRNGNLLKPGTGAYDIAPMAKRLNVEGKLYDDILFTDFKLDGTSKNTYFYSAREVGSTTQLGDFSTIKGPVKLVNTKAPENPEIKRALPILGTSTFEYEQLPLEFTDIENIEINEEHSITKTSANDWDAGLASRQILRGNSYVTFKVLDGTEGMLGFSSYNTSAHCSTIQYGLYIKANGKLHIYESGNDLGEVGTYENDALFKIEVKGNRIIFNRDEVILYEIPLLKSSDFVLDISLKNTGDQILDIALFSIAPSYTKEILKGDDIPLTFTGKNFVKINEQLITKEAGINADAWDAGAYSVEYIPNYGSISYNVKTRTNIMLGLADDILNQDSTKKIDYSLLASDDGYLSIYKNDVFIEKCVQYDENSLLEIERRNDHLIFKKDQRPFYELALDSNIPLFIDFSMLDSDSEIRNLQMMTTEALVKDIAKNEINPALSFEVNAYQSDQRIRKLNLYRTMRPENSLSVRTMDLVNSIDLVLTNQLDTNILNIKDEFLDLEFIPYSDPLFYRVTVSREVEYAKPKINESDPTILVSEYQPSNPSKLVISSIVESSSPKAPVTTYSFDALANNDSVIDNVILKWNKTVHNGKYHIYQMNTQGNWVKIHELITNDQDVQLFLNETDLDGLLQIKDSDGNPTYHHFKVDSENSVGMLNTKSQILTIPGEAGQAALEGIGSMIIENTNLVR